MQIHQLQPKHKTRGKKRVGRGGRKGTYSGKGLKGQKSRAGRKMIPFIRELIKKYPKLKGYRTFRPQSDTIIINLQDIEKLAVEGEVISPENLLKKQIIRMINGRTPKVKILGTGKLSKKITVEGCKFSASAKIAIEKAGGAVK